MVGISKAFALRFLRNILKMKKKSTWWAPHLLNEEQTYTHVRTARKLLKRFPGYDQKLFMNVVTYDESWMHYFEPHRKISNRVWLSKMQAIRITSVKMVMYAIFFTPNGLAIEVSIPKGKSMNTRFYRNKVLRKFVKFYPKCWPKIGICGIYF